METQREYKRILHPWVKWCALVIALWSVAAIVINFNQTVEGFTAYIPIAVKVLLYLADLTGLFLILSHKSLGFWILLFSGVITLLLMLLWPTYMPAIPFAINIALKAVFVVMLALKNENNLSGFQTLGMSKIEDRYIDEWISGERRVI